TPFRIPLPIPWDGLRRYREASTLRAWPAPEAGFRRRDGRAGPGTGRDRRWATVRCAQSRARFCAHGATESPHEVYPPTVSRAYLTWGDYSPNLGGIKIKFSQTRCGPPPPVVISAGFHWLGSVTFRLLVRAGSSVGRAP